MKKRSGVRRRTATGELPTPCQIYARRVLLGDERCAFDFAAEPGPGWLFAYCPEHSVADDEDACAGCVGWGRECSAIWYPGEKRTEREP